MNFLSCSNKRLIPLLVCCFFSATLTFAQTNCEDAPCAQADAGNGPDICDAKLYCSNSDAVDDGFIACTTAADTDGCGVDASVDAVPTGDTEQLLLDLNDPNCFQSGWNVQWIKFMTDDFENQIKIQGVGGPLDSWAVFWVEDWTYDPLDPLAENAPCDPADLAIVDACVSVNQWTVIVNENSTEEINLYYIALIYENTGNGTINFKTKECDGVPGCDVSILCPPDATFECDDEMGIFDWLGTVEVSSCGAVYTAVNDLDDLTFPDCNNTAGTVTVTFHLEDSNGNIILDDFGNPYQCTADLTIEDTTPPVCPTPPADLMLQCADDVPAPVDLTATDNCSDDITVGPTADITPGNCPNQFTMVRTWTFVDDCGNQCSVSQTIEVNDDTPPVCPTPPADLMLQCADDVPPPVDLTATDNCDGDITVSPFCSYHPRQLFQSSYYGQNLDFHR